MEAKEKKATNTRKDFEMEEDDGLDERGPASTYITPFGYTVFLLQTLFPVNC